MPINITWPWPCLGLDRPQLGRSELSAIGRSIYRLECLILMHDHDLVLVLTAHNQGGRSSQQSGRSIYRSKCLILIHDHDLVLVLTAHNRGGHSCLRPGHCKFTVGHLCHFFYEIFVFLYIYLRCLLGVVGEFCGTWLPFVHCNALPFTLTVQRTGKDNKTLESDHCLPH